ncbi:MAG TPA: hypothetical protein VG318_17795 [Actinomycetota bacterium]|nr:hypothetical protein [Actinomycetota bacterium]
MKNRLTGPAAALAACALLAGAPSTGARGTAPRTQTLEYTAGGISAGPDQTTVVTVGDDVGKVVFRGGPERFVDVEVADAHGLPVTAVVSQGTLTEHYVCGASEKPLPIVPHKKVTVFLVNGVCGDAGASVVTTGTVTATFTR